MLQVGDHLRRIHKHIDKFEKQNNHAINVYDYESSICPLRISKKCSTNTINLLLISKDETKYYCWIKNMSRLSSEVSKHRSAKEFCLRCLNHFYSKDKLEKHLEYCSNNEAVKIEMSADKDGNPLHFSFKNHKWKMRVPFVVYADFECFTESISGCSPSPHNSFSNQYQ